MVDVKELMMLGILARVDSDGSLTWLGVFAWLLGGGG
jgi:hypothetical protein